MNIEDIEREIAPYTNEHNEPPSLIQSEEIGSLVLALSKAQGEFPIIGKNQKAKAGAYSYDWADLSAIHKGIKEILSKHELAIIFTPNRVLDKNGVTLMLSMKLLHSSGEYTEGSLPLMLDQSTSQAMGSAISYARRYLMYCMLDISTDDDDDGVAAMAKPPVKKTKDNYNNYGS
jgi:hypothetical protein|tara:strand:- start:904 stop:1428 length:525 start_codon:yes stop_codon:yes gene_type:complete